MLATTSSLLNAARAAEPTRLKYMYRYLNLGS
eukprot:SAG31_NODE_1229_length_9222_cov_5.317549_6_plen_32_part_00